MGWAWVGGQREDEGVGYEDVRDLWTKTCIHGCGPGQTRLSPSSKATSAFPQNPEATGWGREEKHNRATWRERGKGRKGEGREGSSNEAKVTRSVIWEGNSRRL